MPTSRLVCMTASRAAVPVPQGERSKRPGKMIVALVIEVAATSYKHGVLDTVEALNFGMLHLDLLHCCITDFFAHVYDISGFMWCNLEPEVPGIDNCKITPSKSNID